MPISICTRLCLQAASFEGRFERGGAITSHPPCLNSGLTTVAPPCLLVLSSASSHGPVSSEVRKCPGRCRGAVCADPLRRGPFQRSCAAVQFFYRALIVSEGQ